MNHLRLGIALALIAAGCGSQKQSPVQPPGQADQPRSTDRQDERPVGDRPGGDIPQQAVFFAHNSAELTAEGKASLDEQVTWMKENPVREIVVHGYASDVGTPTHNLTLANNRANAIREYLVAQGIEIGRISVLSHGEAGREADPSVERRAVFATDRYTQPEEATSQGY